MPQTDLGLGRHQARLGPPELIVVIVAQFGHVTLMQCCPTCSWGGNQSPNTQTLFSFPRQELFGNNSHFAHMTKRASCQLNSLLATIRYVFFSSTHMSTNTHLAFECISFMLPRKHGILLTTGYALFTYYHFYCGPAGLQGKQSLLHCNPH